MGGTNGNKHEKEGRTRRSVIRGIKTLNILEVGSGTLPRHKHLISRKNWKITRVDINPNAWDVDLVLDVQDGLPFENKTFDVVYCSHVLEHLLEPEMALLHMARVGKNLVLKVPDHRYYKIAQELDSPDHVNHWTPKTFERLVNPYMENYTITFNRRCSSRGLRYLLFYTSTLFMGTNEIELRGKTRDIRYLWKRRKI